MSEIAHNIVAVMLAGGQGSRLFELTDDMCKPAVPFAGGGRIVDWTMANLADCAPARLLVATQYRPAALVDHLNTTWRDAFAPGTMHIRDGETVTGQPEGYAGTADAVTRNLSEIMAPRPDHVLVVAADHVYRMDYSAMIAAHRASGMPVTVAVDRVPLAQARAFGVISVDGTGRVREFDEKPQDPKPMARDPSRALVSMGIYVFDAAWLRNALVADHEVPLSSHDFGHDILPDAVLHGAVQAYDVAEHEANFFWRDVGTLDALRETCIAIATGSVRCACPAYPDMAARGKFTRVLPGGTVVLPGAEVSRGARLQNTIVAPGAHVPRDLVAGFNRYHDEQHFRVTPSGTVLITPRMLARHAEYESRINLLRA